MLVDGVVTDSDMRLPARAARWMQRCDAPGDARMRDQKWENPANKGFSFGRPLAGSWARFYLGGTASSGVLVMPR